MLLSLAMTAAAAVQVGPTFPIDEAARCAVIFDASVAAMAQASNVPQEHRSRAEEGWAVWYYELNTWQTEMSRDAVEAALGRAFEVIQAEMPMGEGAEDAAQRGDYLMSQMSACGTRVMTTYDGRLHPAIAEANAAPMPPAETAATAETAEPVRRGLR